MNDTYFLTSNAMDPKITYPRVFVKNREGIYCQIIRNEREKKEFNKIDTFRRCLITDLLNYNAWKKGEAPYNQDNIQFAIDNNYFEAFTGQKMK